MFKAHFISLKKTDQYSLKAKLQSILNVCINPLPIMAFIAADDIYCCYFML
jgi:hypothetical protein